MIKVLRLADMIFRPQGNFARRIVHAAISIALRLFFRRIETDGVESVPTTEPVIFVLNHPNGLIDPALVFVALPRRVSFLAKSTLFGIPFFGFMLRALETLPLYRRVDAPENAAANVLLNQRTFAACFKLLGQNRCIALFPEGVSHNSTHLLPVKTGAARIALGALAINDHVLIEGNEAKRTEQSPLLKSLKIVPVGLYYTSRTSFRSEALLRFGAAFEVSPVAPDPVDGQPPREAVRELSEKIAGALKNVTLNVDTSAELETVGRVEQLFSSVYESLNFRVSLSEELDLRRKFAEKFEAQESAARQLKNRLDDYDNRLRELGVSPEHLSVSKHSLGFVYQHFLLRLAVILILAPLVVVGALVHLPAYLLCLLLSGLFRRHGVDDSGGSVKILAALVLMPLTWIIIAGLAFWLTNWQVALIVFPATVLSGYVALRCLEELFDLRGWFKAIWVLFRRRSLFIRLLLERRTLHREIARIVSPSVENEIV